MSSSKKDGIYVVVGKCFRLFCAGENFAHLQRFMNYGAFDVEETRRIYQCLQGIFESA